MSAARLDRDRPFGQVCGGAEGWRYEQDGKRFDAEGFEVVDPPPVENAGEDEQQRKLKRRSR